MEEENIVVGGTFILIFLIVCTMGGYMYSVSCNYEIEMAKAGLHQEHIPNTDVKIWVRGVYEKPIGSH